MFRTIPAAQQPVFERVEAAERAGVDKVELGDIVQDCRVALVGTATMTSPHGKRGGTGRRRGADAKSMA